MFCSPLRRCLETARQVLNTKQNTNLKLIVKGDIWEVLSSQCDAPVFIRKSIKKYTEFDFSELFSSIEKYGEFFVIDYLDNAKSKETMKKLASSIYLDTPIFDTSQLYINMLKKGHLTKKLVEGYSHLDIRVKRFKKFIKKFIKTNDV